MSQSVEETAASRLFPRLLERVAKGERITITRHGKPIARLVPVKPAERPDAQRVVAEMLAWRDRQGPTLGPDLTVRDLIEEGRRF
jgi:prevent-host-death family protein